VPRRRFQKGNISVRGKTPMRYGMFREDVCSLTEHLSVFADVSYSGLSAVCQSVQRGNCYSRTLIV
jgi:hypothetical protein